MLEFHNVAVNTFRTNLLNMTLNDIKNLSDALLTLIDFRWNDGLTV